MRWSFLAPAFLFVFSLAATSSNGEALPSFEQAAEKVQAATLTVRVMHLSSNKDEASSDGPKVTVFTGVSLGKGLVVTPLFSTDQTRVRLTLPGGGQADGRTVVLDEHSGLALLEIDRKEIAGLDLADAMPKVGGWVLSGAAWGVEKPVVSFGIVSGVERMLPGANYPPLLACDLRTAATSSGAPIVNDKGQLLGIVVAADKTMNLRGWTYAVPVDHVRRLLRAKNQHETGGAKSTQLRLYRRRPIVGMVLDGKGGKVVVSRVETDGPAHRAGIKSGDQILAADGVQIRSVYQAVSPTLFKQPGDSMTFLVKQANGEKTIQVVLGGGIVVPGVQVVQSLAPQVTVGNLAARKATAEHARAIVRELFYDGNSPDAVKRDPQKWLERAIERYLGVIGEQRKEVFKLRKEKTTAKERISDLETENETLRRELARLRGQKE